MSHLPHPRRCRTLLYSIFLLFLITILFKSRFPRESPNKPLNEHLDTPVYEHASPYRLHANRTHEANLEKQLIEIEESITSSLLELEKDIRAPKKIWQITSAAEAPNWKGWTQEWATKNPQWEIKQYTASPDPDILPHFRSIPSISQTLSAHTELEVDLFRWLLLWYHGGFYLEPDIWPRMGIQECFDMDSIEHPSLSLPRRYPNSTGRYVEQRERSSPISLVLGIDIDEPYMAPHIREKWGWSRTFSFATYAMWAPARFDPLLRKAIVRCVSHSSMSSLFGEEVDSKESGEVCGGAMLTDIVLEMLTENLKEVHKVRDMDAGLERRVTWKKFRALRSPYWFSAKDFNDRNAVEENLTGLGILPIKVWGSGQRHSGSGTFGHEDACTNHVYRRRPSVSLWQKVFG
ncbi:hypothetical protein BOTNAR_0332g00040 [Botryotinia narcissicola]|uniref:Glycosyltransferase family 32 protein n=1 Tax=Botryotinia narcissicola TaxID=278944 RepID=A0A4Z1HTV3_9HELO|nr:hypothetical protein BOTNAR_0332g00040 [Botryotinia narcissicola]